MEKNKMHLKAKIKASWSWESVKSETFCVLQIYIKSLILTLTESWCGVFKALSAELAVLCSVMFIKAKQP